MRESNIPTSSRPERSGNATPISVELAVQHPLPVDQPLIEAIVRDILRDHQIKAAEISIAIVTDAVIRQLNRDYLNHNYETDVLSFVLNHDQESGWLEGEVVVSADTALAVAGEQGISAHDELLLYVIHGTLHLAGLDDGDKTSRLKMRDAERKYTSRFGIAWSDPDQEQLNHSAS